MIEDFLWDCIRSDDLIIVRISEIVSVDIII